MASRFLLRVRRKLVRFKNTMPSRSPGQNGHVELPARWLTRGNQTQKDGCHSQVFPRLKRRCFLGERTHSSLQADVAGENGYHALTQIGTWFPDTTIDFTLNLSYLQFNYLTSNSDLLPLLDNPHSN